MERHLFLNKTNTIFEGSKSNTGMNPVISLVYGNGISRALLHFSEKEMTEMIMETGAFINDSLSFKLVMKNCSSLIGDKINSSERELGGEYFKRASSFDLIAFKLPRDFDRGNGSSVSRDLWYDTDSSYSTEGSNWYNASTLSKWKPDKETEMGIKGMDEGVFSIDFLSEEYANFKEGKESVVIADQHFENGSEDLNMDISSYVLSVLKGEIKNYGIGLAFSPELEKIKEANGKYAGFFSNNTNTVFHPFVSIVLGENIDDSRINFHGNKENKLFFFSEINGESINLDTLPKCTVDDVEYPVSILRRGVYFVTVPKNAISGEEYTNHYDVWSNIVINGEEIEPIEQMFTLLPSERFGRPGSISRNRTEFVPQLSGIKSGVELNRGEVRQISARMVEEYNVSNVSIDSDLSYKVYMKDGKSEYTIFDFQKFDIYPDGIYATKIFTEDLVPGKYFVDIMSEKQGIKRIYKKKLFFYIKSDKKDAFI